MRMQSIRHTVTSMASCIRLSADLRKGVRYILNQERKLLLSTKVDKSTYNDIPPNGYCAILVVYFVYLTLSQGLRKAQAQSKLKTEIAANREAICKFIDYLLTMLAGIGERERIKECLMAMAAALHRGMETFPDNALWLRTDHVAELLRSLKCKTTVWNNLATTCFELMDITTLPSRPIQFSPDQLRAAVSDPQSTMHVVNYGFHFTIIPCRSSPADVDNMLLELEAGLVSAINDEGPTWREGIDLATVNAMEHHAAETMHQTGSEEGATRSPPQSSMTDNGQYVWGESKEEGSNEVCDSTLGPTMQDPQEPLTFPEPPTKEGESTQEVSPGAPEAPPKSKSKRTSRRKKKVRPREKTIPLVTPPREDCATDHPNQSDSESSGPINIQGSPPGSTPVATGPDLSWSDIVSGNSGCRTQGHCILDLIELGPRTMAQLSIINRPEAPVLPTGPRRTSRQSVPPDFLGMAPQPSRHAPPTSVHYHLNSDPESRDSTYLARSNRTGETCFRAYADREFAVNEVIGKYSGVRCSHNLSIGKHIFSDNKHKVAVDASSPTSSTMRYAGDTFDKVDGNNAYIKYNEELDEFLVYAHRPLEQHEAIGIAFGGDYWHSLEWDTDTLRKAKECYGAVNDSEWSNLIREKVRQQNIALGIDEYSDTGSEDSSSDSDSEPQDSDPTKLPYEMAEGAKQHISKPRTLFVDGPTQFDPLYTNNLLDAPEVKTMDASHHKALYFNINGSGHRSGSQEKDNHNVEKAIVLFARTGADSMFLLDARVTAAKKNHIKDLVVKLIPGAHVIFHLTTCTPGESEENSMQCMGGMIIIISPEWANLWYITRAEQSGLGLIARVEFSTEDGQKIRVIGAYIPPRTAKKGKGTLDARLRTYLSSIKWKGSPEDYLERVLGIWVSTGHSRGHFVILGGDFNAVIDRQGLGKQRNISNWVDDLNLVAPLTEILLPHAPNYQTHYSGIDRNPSRIDHVFHSRSSSGIKCSEVGVCDDTFLADFDHRPVWIGIKLSKGIRTAGRGTPTKRPPQLTLNLKNEEMMTTYNRLLHEFKERNPIPLDSTEAIPGLLSAFHLESIKAVKQIAGDTKARIHAKCQKARSPCKDGYSPTARVMQDALQCMIEISRKAFSRNRNHRWSKENYFSILQPLVAKWELRVRLCFPEVDSFTLGLGITCPSQLRQMPYDDLTRSKLDESIRAMRSLLHGRKRQDMRRRMNERVAKIERLRLDNKLGKVIRLLGDKQYTTLDLSTLRGEDGCTRTTPSAVTSLCNTYFRDWFGVPSKLDPAAMAIETSKTVWKELVDPPDWIIEQMDNPNGVLPPIHEDSRIPKDLQDGLRRACRRKATPQMETDMKVALDEPFSLEEFTAAIRHLSPDKAPGPSMVNSNMIKGWDDGMIAYVHSMMQALWEHKTIPIWWKDHVLSPLPKIAGNTELKNMRPISLFEIIRKLWTGMIVHRIQSVWTNHNILHSSQHGFRWRQGTDTALLRIIDALEDAREFGTEARMTLWDLRRAFDSVSRNFLRLAWTRLGVPAECVAWLTGLDEGGSTYVSSPHLYDNIEPRTTEEMLDSDGHFLSNSAQGFTAIRGVGQGDSSGPLCWIAVFDVLLCWVDAQDPVTHPETNPEEEMPTDSVHTDRGSAPTPSATDNRASQDYAPTPSVSDSRAAYADDLADCVYSIETQRKQALWVSAFCAATGLEISIGKIVTVVLNGPHSLHGDTLETMTIYNSQWQPQTIDIKSTTALIKYLGVEISMDGNDDTAYEWAVDKLRQSLLALSLKKADGESKMQVVRFSILPKILYRASKAAWKLSRYTELDTILARGIKKILGKWKGYSHELLFIPTSQGGIGCPRISDLAQEYKWSAIQRALVLGGQPARAAKGMIERAAHQEDTQLVEGKPCRIMPSKRKGAKGHLFIDSLLEWAAMAGLHLQTQQFRGKDREDLPMVHGTGHKETLEKLGITIDNFANDVNPETRVGGIFTDGSYKMAQLKRRSVIEPMEALRKDGVSGAAVVLLGTPEKWKTAPVRILRIIPAFEAGEMDAFCSELVGITFGIRIAEGLPEHITLYSDCMAAIARGHAALAKVPRAMGHLRNGPICVSLRDRTVAMNRLIEWIKAHPEKRKNRSQFTYEEWGSFLADLAAEGQWQKIRELVPQVKTHEIILEDIMDEILPIGSWHWRDTEGKLVMSGISTRVASKRGEKYKQARDDKRVAEGRPRRWVGTATELAASCVPDRSNKSFHSRFAATNSIFDTIPDGRKQALGKKTPQEKIDANKCPVCGKPDSQRHRYLHCPHAEFTDIRQRAHKLQLDAVDKIRKNLTTGQSHLLHFASNIVRAAWKSPVDPERLWLGTWNEDTLWRVCINHNESTVDQAIEPEELMHMQKIIRQVTEPLASAVRQLWKARGAIVQDKNPPSLSSSMRPGHGRSSRRSSGKTTEGGRVHQTPNFTSDKPTGPHQSHIDSHTVALPTPSYRQNKRKSPLSGTDSSSHGKPTPRQAYLTDYAKHDNHNPTNTIFTPSAMMGGERDVTSARGKHPRSPIPAIPSKKAKSTHPLPSTSGKRARASVGGTPDKRSKPHSPMTSAVRKREAEPPRRQQRKKCKSTTGFTASLPPPYSFTIATEVFPDTKDNP
jgi:hypothetical protein